ncbi:receptor-like protein 2 [Prunus yedoensis var. nudiflora]|uniref:Receptor-like protein 2 n=1 Tax=Prunus yedoensis var. nudiflora TaxID=2094558 RepID=A0A314ZGM3_PRUYE|nr:receptor-like protein 2 [Prunus yedoensis var. nudiflora]
MLVQAYDLMAHAFLLFLLFSYIIIYIYTYSCLQTERSSLLSFASTLSSPPLNWTSLDCCRWKGITLIKMVGSPVCSCLPKGSKEFFFSLNQLEILDLSYNRLFEELPPSLPSSNIQTVDLSSNHFFGAIPSSFLQQASNLTSFNVSNNTFTGGNLAPGLGKCSKLQVFRAGHNNLSGLFLEDIYNATKLELPLNSLHGTISHKIVNLTNLATLDLYCNHFGGELPLNLGKLSKLKSLKDIGLAGNHLEGQIEAEILSLKSLSFLSLGYNQFTNLTGAMKILMSCRSLHTLLLSGSFCGEGMPSDDDMVDFLGFQNLRFLALVCSNLTGQIPLCGYIPPEIGQLLLLRKLALDSNHFFDIIPNQISNLKHLEVLDLSTNHLSGIIPSSLVSLNFLKEFNASYNNLEGPIPTGTQLQSFNASTFEGNLKLCGASLLNKCGPSKSIDADNKNNKDVDNGLHQLPWFYIFTTLGFIVGFWGICGSLVINKTWRYAYFRFIDNLQDRLYVMIS